MVFGKQYSVNSVAEFYEVAATDLLNAEEIAPRGLKTKEIISPQIIIRDPRNRLVYNEKRKFNIFHALNESILLYSLSNKVEHIAEFNKNMALFSDDGETMHGSYGKRIASYIVHIVKKLREDPNTRQAVLTIHQSGDLKAITKDVPCTENLQFLIRDNKLVMIVNMRSNDILYGFQFDVFMFTMLQETIANTLGIDVGPYIHNPASLHVYKEGFSFNGYEMLEEMAANSSNVRLKNNSNLKDWHMLSFNHTDKVYSGFDNYGNVKTTDEIEWLILQERIYRDIKKQGLEKGSPENYWNIIYDRAPEWAKPFITKWQG